MYIVKGNIREYVIYGNNKLLRRGSPHFLPNTEVVLSHFYNSQYRLHNKLWVRGIHKSGLLKKKPVYFKFLTRLRLEEVKNPSTKTLEFIKENQILTTGIGGSGYPLSEVEALINFFKEIEEPEVEPSEINDELFLMSKNYIADLQGLLVAKKFDEIAEDHFKYPIEVKQRRESKSIKVDKNEFELSYKEEFIERIGKTIIETDLETIFPTNKRMIIGLVEIEITNGNKFQISKIETE